MSDSIWPSIIAATVPSVISAIGGAFGAKTTADATKENLEFQREQAAAENAYKYAALDQAWKIAQMNAASSGAGAGATLAAARITDARERLRMKQEAAQALLAGRLRSLEMVKPEVIGAAQHDAYDSYQKGAARTQDGFMGLAQLLQQPFSQVGRPVFGR